jgi:signal peptide peptidase SppA
MSDNIFAIMPNFAGFQGKNHFPAVKPTELMPGTALLMVSGVLYPEKYATIGEKITNFARDAAIARIIIAFSSPGGSVLGISPAVDAIRLATKQKPVIAISSHVCASAAYWLACQANKVLLASKTAVVGSIGVIATHFDASKNDSNWGFKISEFVTGTYKNVTSPHHPVDDTAKAYYQSRVEEIYEIFVNDVAHARKKLTPEAVRGFEGMDYMGQSAIDKGLADGFVDFMEVLSMDELEIQALASPMAVNEKEKDKESAEEPEDEETEEEKKKKAESEKEKDKESAILSDRVRIAAILELAGVNLPKHVAKAIAGGESCESFALLELKQLRSNTDQPKSMLSRLKAEAPSAVAGGFMPEGEGNVDAILKSAADHANNMKRRK